MRQALMTLLEYVRSELDFTVTEYLVFQWAEHKAKTSVHEVLNKRSGEFLGKVAWYGPWRQYTFAPEPNCELHPDWRMLFCSAT